MNRRETLRSETYHRVVWLIRIRIHDNAVIRFMFYRIVAAFASFHVPFADTCMIPLDEAAWFSVSIYVVLLICDTYA